MTERMQGEISSLDAPALGMWLFIASEGMFFVALMGAFVVLGSQQHQAFAESSRLLSRPIGACGALLLVAGSVALLRKAPLFDLAAMVMAILYLCLQIFQVPQFFHRDNFFGSCLLFSFTHDLHLLAAGVAGLWFLIVKRLPFPSPLRVYWHFVNLVGLLGLASLYFV